MARSIPRERRFREKQHVVLESARHQVSLTRLYHDRHRPQDERVADKHFGDVDLSNPWTIRFQAAYWLASK